jgi:hypothetical protein
VKAKARANALGEKQSPNVPVGARHSRSMEPEDSGSACTDESKDPGKIHSRQHLGLGIDAWTEPERPHGAANWDSHKDTGCEGEGSAEVLGYQKDSRTS